MAKRKTPCRVGGCGTYAKEGLRVCSKHDHVLLLQQEIERLRSTRGSGLEILLDRFPTARDLLENLAVAVYRADPLKGSPISAVSGGRHHGLSDGIITIGEDRLRPGYAASTSQDEGRLGSVVGVIASANAKVERILDQEPRSPDPRPRCGRRECPNPNVRQPVGIRWCGFCGRSMATVSDEEL